ncbi:tetratricopeptide repeat protein [Streptomyces sp. NPDC053750]|uniref:tetratricopeptide repeat protein n=1 Tax=Streptomyces sp. NPDC053750 TaxID=3365714 RepID=UPI0037D58EB2
MARQVVSRRELIRRRRRSSFVGRRGELDAFRANFGRSAEDPAYGFLFHVHGNAGVGKSTLVRQWESVAAEAGAVTVYLDDAVHGPLEVMEAISARLAAQGCEMRRFDKQAERLRQRVNEARVALLAQAAAQDGPGAGAAQPSVGSSLAAQAGLIGLGMVPVVGAVAGAVDPAQLALGTDRIRTAVGGRGRAAAAAELAEDPVALLTPVFLEDLAAIAAQRPWVVLFFDVYERTGPALDSWLYGLACGETSVDLPSNIQVVLAGQGELDPRVWNGGRDLITEVPLEVFTEQEARALLTGQGITEEPVVEVILRMSGRLPVLVHMLAQGRPGSAEHVDDPAHTAVELFLKWVAEDELRAAALACALPLEFDEDVFRAVVPEAARNRFSWIRTLAFVTDRAGRCRYHEVVRAPMVRLRRTQSPSEWRAAHEALAEFHAALRARTEQDAAFEPWFSHLLNEHYHLLCLAPHQKLNDVLAALAEFARRGPVTARSWLKMLEQAGHDSGRTDVATWAGRLQASVRGDDGDTLPVLDALLSHPGLDPAGQAAARLARGRLHRDAERSGEALADFDAAVSLDPENAEARYARGLAHRDADRYDQALADFGEAMRVDPEDPWPVVFRGQTHLWQEDWERALADFDHAIELDQGLGLTWYLRAHAYASTGDHERALADLDRSIQVQPDQAAAHADRSSCLSRLLRHDEAVLAMERAVELSPSTLWYRVHLADRLRDVGRREECLREIDRALVDPVPAELLTSSFPFSLRAWALHGLGRADEAQECLRHALRSVAEPDATVFAQQGWLFWEAGDLEHAERCFDRALTREAEYPWAYIGRGMTQVYDGRPDDAVNSFTQGFKIQLAVPAATAEQSLARPLVELITAHLPTQREALTAAARLCALLSWQQQWPHLSRQLTTVLAHRPSPRLLAGALRLLGELTTVIGTGPETEEQRRVAWTLRMIRPLQAVLARLPGSRAAPAAGDEEK